MGGLIVGIILILIGISALTGIPLFGFLFAVVLIAIGIRMIAHRSVHSGWHWDYHDHDHDHDNHHHDTTPASGERSIDEVADDSIDLLEIPQRNIETLRHLGKEKIMEICRSAGRKVE